MIVCAAREIEREREREKERERERESTISENNITPRTRCRKISIGERAIKIFPNQLKSIIELSNPLSLPSFHFLPAHTCHTLAPKGRAPFEQQDRRVQEQNKTDMLHHFTVTPHRQRRLKHTHTHIHTPNGTKTSRTGHMARRWQGTKRQDECEVGGGFTVLFFLLFRD